MQATVMDGVRAMVAGLRAGTAPLWPALWILLRTAVWSAALLLAGGALVLLARAERVGGSSALQWLGEGLMLLGASVALVGAVRGWWVLFRANWRGE